MKVPLPLPTSSSFPPPSTVDAHAISTTFLTRLSTYLSQPTPNIPAALSLFLDHSYWRDLLAFTWDFRTFSGKSAIAQFLHDRVACTQPGPMKLRETVEEEKPVYLQAEEDQTAWVQACFTFDTKVGECFGIVRLVPVPATSVEGEWDWKVHTIFTNLESLHSFPELSGPLRSFTPNHGKWKSQREEELTLFEHEDPTVLIVGAGQSGLDVAARLKYLGVKALVVERNERVGDNWRGRYEHLCLHDRVWYDHMPYIPFPSTWPVYTPAKKLANWLESYASSLELNIWTSTTVLSATQDEDTKMWRVVVRRDKTGASAGAVGVEREFVVRHFVMATGFAGKPYMPTIPGADTFPGLVLHSTQHKRASDHAGKKVVVVGACTAAHDICVDYVDNGVDVTMVQRNPTYIMSTKNGFEVIHKGLYEEGGPPTDLADRLDASFPRMMALPMYQRKTREIAVKDKETLDGLANIGFKTSLGQLDAGFLIYVWERAGGYYLDVGASQYLIDGKIKLKPNGHIERFTEKGLKFEDGSEVEADVVVFATGLGSARDLIRDVCGNFVADNIGEIWGLDDEGEVRGVARDLGLEGFWCMMGNLCFCRFHSKHLALQIKAMEEGAFGSRYTT